MIIGLTLSLAAGLWPVMAEGQAKPFTRMQVITLQNGPNQVDIDGDGQTDLIFIAWRENYNAHGFDMVTFYVLYKDAWQARQQWYLIPFFDEKGVPRETSYRTTMGADCVLSDLRVLRPVSPANAPVTVIIGDRDFGASYADVALVKFRVYRLAHNKEGLPGEPPYYFKLERTLRGHKKYCDINEAFRKELGLGSYRQDCDGVSRPLAQWDRRVRATRAFEPGLTTACRRRLPASARPSLPLPAAPDARRSVL